MKKYNVSPKSIGRLEVGTETILDKSKSVKSVLMQLFTPFGNSNIEGVDTCNACYGGTNALFNAVNWVESSAWDGRNAIVVAGDIAIYEKGAARPTGGTGVVAMLVGPDAEIVFEPGRRGSYFQHAYDFYKPDLTSEYPVVDGQYSLECYTRALDSCYSAYTERTQSLQAAKDEGYNSDEEAKRAKDAEAEETTSRSASPARAAPTAEDSERAKFDYMCFHSPSCKLVTKSYSRLFYNDYLRNPNDAQFNDVPGALRQIDYEASLSDKSVEKAFMALAKKDFKKCVEPSTYAATMIGNTYTASVYFGLAALLSNVSPSELQGKRVGLFSYGSGLASTLFSMHVRGDTTTMREKLNLVERLSAREVVAPTQYEAALEIREKAHLQKGYQPQGSIFAVPEGAFYLTNIDDKYRRFYDTKA